MFDASWPAKALVVEVTFTTGELVKTKVFTSQEGSTDLEFGKDRVCGAQPPRISASAASVFDHF